MSTAVVLPASLLVALLVVVVAFVVARRRGRYDTIDTAWGAGFALLALVGFALVSAGVGGARSSGATAALVTVLTVAWGARLSVHIHRRNAGKPEDPRYRALAARAGDKPAVRMFVRVYLTQAVVLWWVALPVQVAQYEIGSGSPGLNVLAWAGIGVWTVGFLCESVGDEQLRRFKADPANAGRVLDRGLWRYTRHPNYFGDACVWWGLYLVACHHWLGAATILSPLLMTWLLARGTGKPLLERGMREKHPAYADYMARTSGFLPWPPKRA